MKVLFVCSGNSKFYEVAPFIRSQGDSLEKEGIEITYFSVLGRGAMNYLKNVSRLRKFIKENDFDVIHAHYSFCGWVAVLAFSGLPLILSLMGDDAVGTPDADGRLTFKSRILMALSYAVQPFVTAIISKSPNLEATVYRKKVSHLIPNGVRLDQFVYQPEGYREELNMQEGTQYVVFMGNPTDPNKNVALVQEAMKYVKRENVELVVPYPVSHDTVVKYLNSADVFTLCSFSEGSPNIVKEAMSCNRPMVVTPAGDAAWVVEGTQGCFVGDYDPEDFSAKLNQALDFAAEHQATKGRDRILELELDAVSIARRIISLYQEVSGKEKLSPSIN